MAGDILGIHHVTALCGAPGPNLRFYERVLGLRLVKKTVNFDAPTAYHFYFGDRIGRPGTLITFFPHPAFRKGRAGAREVARTDFAIPQGALGYWSNRLVASEVEVLPKAAFDGRERLSFVDPDGTRLSLIEDDLASVGGEPPPAADVPPNRAIRGIASVATVVNATEPTAAFLRETLGFAPVKSDGRRSWFAVGGTAPRLEVIEDPAAEPALLGTGSVHHVAWRVADDATQAEIGSRVKARVEGVTPVRDRNYFRSIYFREPGGVIFEIATDGPGFLIDENEATLGQALKLPSQFEPHRFEIEAALPSLEE